MNPRELRLLFLVAGAIVFVDTMFYAAVAPLLPSLSRELHLSKASAGVLTAGYAIGTLIGAIPGGLLAERAGPRITLYTGLALMGASSLAFGLVDNIVLLDAARVVQGFGGACTWAGSLAWLVAEVPARRRGSVIGGALAAGIGGALFGPVIGTLAHALGRATVFSAVVVVAAALMIAVASLPSPSPLPREYGRTPAARSAAPAGDRAEHVAGRAARDRVGDDRTCSDRSGSGTRRGRGRDRRHVPDRGRGRGASISPAVGHVSDRRGRMLPLRVGLGATSIVLLFFTLPQTAALLAVVIVARDGRLGHVLGAGDGDVVRCRRSRTASARAMRWR